MAWLPDHIWLKQKAQRAQAAKGQGKGNASKGKGKGQGTWIFVQNTVNTKSTPWVKSKGGKSSGGKGKGSQSRKTSYSELSEEKKAEIRAKHEARAEEEGRETVGNRFFLGTLKKRGRFNGWIMPTFPGQLPGNVKAKLKEMTATQKARAEERGQAAKFDDGVIYVRMSDVCEGVKVDPGDKVKFKVYVDSEGVGAYEVQLA
eukprot:TRINITY_DN80142_c0_g1_i1.p1 TRINITY_DN80142_c0_g1~~TRINITY_DN80142_c0_g1_i1.p1  ORF type:complete len:226 (-),score=58.47 TRINITY_DN80142_c0_g1_i1:53-658(-)